MTKKKIRFLCWFIGIAAGFGIVAVWQSGCESFAPSFAEARAAAQDAQEAAERAEVAAEASGDPEAIRLAREAKEQADGVDAALGVLETQALEWAEKAQAGEFGAKEGAEIGSLVTLIDPRAGAIATILGGVVGGWFYRRRAVQIIKAIDAGKEASPGLDDAFGTDAARKAISKAMSPATWKFVENQRN
tara:strand:+ start:9824 stop:10390 length:567 start_codon:yes stop_codon:yes gene_type:complete